LLNIKIALVANCYMKKIRSYNLFAKLAAAFFPVDDNRLSSFFSYSVFSLPFSLRVLRGIIVTDSNATHSYNDAFTTLQLPKRLL